MKLSKSISVFLSLSLLLISTENVAWTGHGGGYSGGHGGMAYGGHRGYGGGYRGGYSLGYGYGYGHGYSYGHGYYGGFYGGVYFDPWLFGYPVGYDMIYPDVVVTPGYFQTYMEGAQPPQSNAPSEAPQSNQSDDWYYCQNPAGYYPYVKICTNGWQRVPSTPPK